MTLTEYVLTSYLRHVTYEEFPYDKLNTYQSAAVTHWICSAKGENKVHTNSCNIYRPTVYKIRLLFLVYNTNYCDKCIILVLIPMCLISEKQV